MQLGMVGLGRMGANMVRRLLTGGHECVVFDMSPKAVEELVDEKATGSSVARGAGQEAGRSRARCGSWFPRRSSTRPSRTFCPRLETGDTIIDGGNSYYVDDIRRAHELTSKGIHYVDVGTSGGVWGLERGYCMMIGGPDDAVQRLDPIFKTLAPGAGSIWPDPRPQGRGTSAELGLSPLRAERRRPFRQDGPQRHRVRHHGRLRGGTEHLARRERRQEDARDRRRDDAAAQSRALPVRPQPARRRRGVAARQRDRLVAARPDGDGPGGGSRALQVFAGRVSIPAKAAGRSRRPSTKACRCRS